MQKRLVRILYLRNYSLTKNISMHKVHETDLEVK